MWFGSDCVVTHLGAQSEGHFREDTQPHQRSTRTNEPVGDRLMFQETGSGTSSSHNEALLISPQVSFITHTHKLEEKLLLSLLSFVPCAGF